jgi:hypothetical protein
MPIKEKLNLAEIKTYQSLVVLLALLAMMIMNVSCADAQDDESIWQALNQGQTVELTLDDTADYEATLDTAVAVADASLVDPEQNTNPELLINTLTVNITSRINVRNIGNSANNFGNIDSSFPRGNAEVIGHFNDGPLQAIAGGTWLILEGGEHAVFSELVYETDGTGVTDAEAATTQEYTYDGSGYVLVVPAEAATPEPEAAPEAPTDNDNDPVTPEPSTTPEALTYPELPDSFEVSWMAWTDGEPGMTEPTTIEINRDSLLPIPLGLIAEGAFESVDQFTDHIESRLTSDGETMTQSALSGILVDVTQDSAGPWTLVIAFPTDDGGWGTMKLVTMQNFYVRPVDNQMNSMDGETEFFSVASDTRMTEDGVIIEDRLPIGSNIIVSFFDPDSDSSSGIANRTRMMCSQLEPTPAIDMIQDGGTCDHVTGRTGQIFTELGGIIYDGE